MPDTRPAEPAALHGIALHTAESLGGLGTTCVRIPAADVARVRAAVDEARTHGRTLTGGWEDVVVVWGRPGRTPVSEALAADPGDVAELRDLLLELNR